METASYSDLTHGIKDESDFVFDGRVFTWSVTSSWGVAHQVCATPAMVREMLPRAMAEWGNDVLDENVEWARGVLNGIIDNAEKAHTDQWGDVLDRRVATVENFAFFTGPGTHKRHEALIRLSGDWWDDSTNPPRQHHAGDVVWVRVNAPYERV